jgi:hypothetical protein
VKPLVLGVDGICSRKLSTLIVRGMCSIVKTPQSSRGTYAGTLRDVAGLMPQTIRSAREFGSAQAASNWMVVPTSKHRTVVVTTLRSQTSISITRRLGVGSMSQPSPCATANSRLSESRSLRRLTVAPRNPAIGSVLA